MARIRSIKPSFFFNENLAQLSPMARLFYIGLWCLADREGRLKDKPMELGAQLIPYEMTKYKPESLLKELEDRFVGRYEAEGKRYLVIHGFTEHQRPPNSEPPSTLPEPPADLLATNLSVASTTGDEQKGQEGKGKEGKGKEGNGDGQAAPGAGVDNSVDTVDNFTQFWKAYPRKVGKAAAMKSWKTKKPPLDKCLRTLSLLVKTDQWMREDGRYIPHPATWLNQGRWDDVPEGFEEFTCGSCKYVGSLRKGFRGRAKCPRCGNEELVGVNQEEL